MQTKDKSQSPTASKKVTKFASQPAATTKKSEPKDTTQKKTTREEKLLTQIKTEKFNVESILETIKPKKALSSYLYFVRHITKDEAFIGQRATEVCRKAGEQWKKLNEKEKLPFVKKAEKDVKRREREMKQFEKLGHFIDEDGIKSTELAMQKRLFKKHITTPKRVKRPFCIFVKQRFEAKKAAIHEDAKATEVIKELTLDWGKLSEREREPFVKAMDADRKRYENELKQLVLQGYFINEKGVKSKNKKTKRPASAEVKAESPVKVEKTPNKILKEKSAAKKVAKTEKPVKTLVKDDKVPKIPNFKVENSSKPVIDLCERALKLCLKAFEKVKTEQAAVKAAKKRFKEHLADMKPSVKRQRK